MLFPLERLLTDRGNPLCIRRDQTVHEALTLMIGNDFSQLPVIDEHGKLLGLVSDEGITRGYFHVAGSVGLLDLTVDHCLQPATTLPRDRDIFEALDRLKDVYALVITSDDNCPEGILTDFDMAHFFRDLTEDLLIVEDIETSLRQIAQAVLAEEDVMNAALIAASGEDRDDPGTPRKSFDELTFGNLIHLIRNEMVWGQFQHILRPLDLFWQYMDQVRQHRNQLAHFRGRLDHVQHDLLKRAQHWLETRPNLPDYGTATVREDDVSAARETRGRIVSGKYAALRDFLETAWGNGETRLGVRFADIERLIGEELPESARRHPSWWGNQYDTVQAKAWLEAGWLVDSVELNRREVNFRHSRSALYPPFFSELLHDLKERRPGITSASKVSLDNWVSFSSGVPGFAFSWVLPRESVLRVELYIDKGENAVNKATFEGLLTRRYDIEDAVGAELTWQKLENRRASRICIDRDFDITDPRADRQAAIEWGVSTMLAFYDALVPRLRNL